MNQSLWKKIIMIKKATLQSGNMVGYSKLFCGPPITLRTAGLHRRKTCLDFAPFTSCVELFISLFDEKDEM